MRRLLKATILEIASFRNEINSEKNNDRQLNSEIKALLPGVELK